MTFPLGVPSNTCLLALIVLLIGACALDEPNDTPQAPPKNSGSTSCHYACCTYYDATIQTDDDWLSFVDCGCTTINDLIIKNISTFDGKAPIDLAINGDLRFKSNSVAGLTIEDSNGNCTGGLCNVTAVNGNLKVFSNDAMTSSVVPTRHEDHDDSFERGCCGACLIPLRPS